MADSARPISNSIDSVVAGLPDMPQLDRHPDPSALAKYGPLISQMADAYTTHRVLNRGGRELNPAMMPLANKGNPIGIPLMYLAKLGIGLHESKKVSDLQHSGDFKGSKKRALLATALPLLLAAANTYQMSKPQASPLGPPERKR